MPKSTGRSKRRLRRGNVRKRRNNTAIKSSTTSMPIHRRLVVFPKTSDSTWLQSLSWFSSIALKLFTLVVGVTDDLCATTSTIGSGTTMILGAGDFAAVSPFAVPTTNTTDKEMMAAKTFSYEQARLSTISVKIVPAVDAGYRGGMYAAVLIPIDQTDAELSRVSAAELVSRFDNSYDDIIKHPRARMAQVTQSLSLSYKIRSPAHDIRVNWDNTVGLTNAFPCVALCVAYSDLANADGKDTDYSPARSLFEVHLRGGLQLSQPGGLTLYAGKSSESQSIYTPKILRSDSAKLAVKWFDHRFESSTTALNLREIKEEVAEHMLTYYGRLDLLPKLKAHHTAERFEMIQ